MSIFKKPEGYKRTTTKQIDGSLKTVRENPFPDTPSPALPIMEPPLYEDLRNSKPLSSCMEKDTIESYTLREQILTWLLNNPDAQGVRDVPNDRILTPYGSVSLSDWVDIIHDFRQRKSKN